MTTELPLLPMPREVTRGPADEAFTLTAHTAIVLSAAASEETFFAARWLQAAVREVTGLTLTIRRTLSLDEAGAIVLAVAGRDEAAGTLATLPAEGYSLRITADRVTVTGADEAGLFYGVQTLCQLIQTQGGRLPALTIRDWPRLANRGVMLDVSRGKVPTRETLYRLIDYLASLKYNHFQLYIEHTFAFPSVPELQDGTDPLTADDILALDAYCAARHIAFVPNLQSFGHQRRLLSLPRFSHLDEVGWRWSLTPAREETYTLLDTLYREFLPNFRAPWFNADCDETWDLGTGQARALAEQLGRGRLYLRHLVRIRELAARYGKQLMVWADILVHYPDLLGELPEDIVLLDWWYEAQDSYPTTPLLGQSGRRFWVCPGTSSWNTLFPRIENAIGNIRNFVRDGLAAGAEGMLLTDWGDYGHYQPLSLSWYPYAVGAAVAWHGPETTDVEIDEAFAPLVLRRPAGDAAMVAIRQLGRAVTASTLGSSNRSNSAYALFDDPLTGRLIAEADPAALEALEAAATDAAQAWATLPDPWLRYDYGFIARLTAFAARKARQAQRRREQLRTLPDPQQEEGRARGLAVLDQMLDELQAERSALLAYRQEFEQCWLRHARRSEIEQTLQRFRALDGRYAAALQWLADQRVRYAQGNALDAEATSYQPGPYAVLWEEGFWNIVELAKLAGIEAVPDWAREIVLQTGLVGGLSSGS